MGKGGSMMSVGDLEKQGEVKKGEKLEQLITRGFRRVLVLMGSASDKEKMLPCIKQLKDLNIPLDVEVISFHRAPEILRALLLSENMKNYAVVIAGGGMAFHMAGAVAAYTIKPVIALPLTSDASPLCGIDALLSSVQMPPGVPVAAVGINSAKNAALLAAAILSLEDKDLEERLLAFRKDMLEKILNEDKKNLLDFFTTP